MGAPPARRLGSGFHQEKRDESSFQILFRGSIFLWQQNRGRAAVRFRDDPDFGPTVKRVSGEQPKAVSKAEFVLAAVVLAYVSPVPGDMSDQIGHGIISGCL
jgi:hypothetical protein